MNVRHSLIIKYERPALADYQIAGLFNDARYAIVEASTKAGKTVACLAWIVEQALKGKEGQEFWWVAPVYNQCRIAYRRLKFGLDKSIFTANESELSISLINGTRIVCKSAEKPDNLYGEDVYGAVFDEASRAREEAWFALRSTLTATRAPVRIIGNVKGRKNWAYKLARKAESGERDMSYKKITAYDAIDAGILSKDEIEDARRQLPDNVFRELYLAEPSDDEGNPFGITAIRQCVKPLSSLPPVAFGIDLAKSVDWTTIYGLDANKTVCIFERFQKNWNETIKEIHRICGATKSLVDSTGVGDAVLESLQDGNKYNFEGFKFTSGSKQQLMEGLAIAIQQNNIGFPAGVTQNELESFEYEYTRTGVKYSAPDGMHDDCVCGLALAFEAVNQPSNEWQSMEFRV